VSTGHAHRHGHGGIGLSAHEVDKALANPMFVRMMRRPWKLDTSHDLPYLAGYSKDGLTRYVDRHFGGDPVLVQPELMGMVKIGGRVINCIPFLVGDPGADDLRKRNGHEGSEKSGIDAFGWRYQHAHEVATAIERRCVIMAGIDWMEYSRALAPYIKADEKEKIQLVPADLDLTPYLSPPVSRSLLAHLKAHMGNAPEEDELPEGEKTPKDEVNYREGNARRHCGPVSKWPTGECWKFIEPNSCKFIRGYIEADDLCDRWESQKPSQ
jgi:hypothetical protein